ncbi:MAG: hypothetical protein ACI9UK_002451 [Candidatus Krumholzibacteriia bacterium]|jgi:hypothetical protein
MSNSEQQTTLVTSHKGVDLHAASALLVMKDRLEGGELLADLLRCEVHSFCGTPDRWDADRLLHTGVYFNPNKHHYGIFTGSALDLDQEQESASAWLEKVAGTDLVDHESDAAALANALLGGGVPAGCCSYDVVSYASGQDGPVQSGVLWRMVIRADEETAQNVGSSLAVARGRKQGLLINPHMESWLAVRR